LSAVLFDLGQNETAIAALDSSIKEKRRLTTVDPFNATWQYELAITLSKLGSNQYALNRPDAALTTLDDARERLVAMVKHDPQNALRRFSLASCLQTIVKVHVKKGDTATARAVAQEALTVLAGADLDNATDEVVVWMRNLKTDFAEFLAANPARNEARAHARTYGSDPGREGLRSVRPRRLRSVFTSLTMSPARVVKVHDPLNQLYPCSSQ
jgi:hypothetical protein